MLLTVLVLNGCLSLTTPQAYIYNAVPVALIPAAGPAVPPGFNPAFVPRRPNLTISCLPPGYDIPNSHSLFYGCRNQTDQLLFSENILKPKRFFSNREKIIEYPGEVPKGHVRNENITAIWCYDQQGYGKGGFCSIMDGGIGKKYVKLHIYHPERNVPLQFKVEIYGNSSNANNFRNNYH